MGGWAQRPPPPPPPAPPPTAPYLVEVFNLAQRALELAEKGVAARAAPLRGISLRAPPPQPAQGATPRDTPRPPPPSHEYIDLAQRALALAELHGAPSEAPLRRAASTDASSPVVSVTPLPPVRDKTPLPQGRAPHSSSLARNWVPLPHNPAGTFMVDNPLLHPLRRRQ